MVIIELYNPAAASNLVKRKMRTDEAMKILNMEQENLTVENVRHAYDKYYQANDPKNGGSFYLQSKIYRAKERLELDLDPDRGRTEEVDEQHRSEAKKGDADENEDIDSNNDSSSSKDSKGDKSK